MAGRATDMSPWTVTHAGNASTSSDLFHFHLELMGEPTAQEGRRIIDCEGHAFLQAQLLGGKTDIDGFIVEGSTPFPTETIRPSESLYDLMV